MIKLIGFCILLASIIHNINLLLSAILQRAVDSVLHSPIKANT